MEEYVMYYIWNCFFSFFDEIQKSTDRLDIALKFYYQSHK